MKLNKSIILCLLSLTGLLSCEKETIPEKQPANVDAFAKGADISWLTEMEKAGRKFYNASGEENDCIELLKSLGMNAIRLRVWVNPSDGWCNKEDMLVKAIRAHNLGMRLMIDFHYSDWWADPGRQSVPGAWDRMNVDELKQAVKLHTAETLELLKKNGITPEWVQVGNETGNGMLWPVGQANSNMAGYAALNNAGYDAVKSVFPEAKVIVHLQDGSNNGLYRWLFDGLKRNNGKWDIIGLSLYPSKENWQTMNNQCIANIKDLIGRYGTETMICEAGMPWEQADVCKAFLTDLIAQAKAIPDEKCQGVFYWEPEAYNNWKGYALGAFDDSGKPTIALEAYK